MAASEGCDPDPDIEASCRRIMAFRRHATKKNELGKMIMQNLADYCEANAKGSEGEETPLDEKVLAGMPKTRRRMELRR